MFRQNHFLTALLFSIILIFSCNKNVVSDVQTNAIAEDSQEQQKSVEHHPYGGWYCPDNFGFPPVDIQHLEKVPVVIGRLPTKEETRNGTSLMYFDPNEYPNAKPLDITLPRVAKINSKNNGLNELIIVIQAVVVNGDTVVGYRFPNGGNGTSWFREISLLSEKEVKAIGPSPYVYIDAELKASKTKIWEAICNTTYAKELGERFNQKAFFESPWTNESKAHLNYTYDSASAKGMISQVWGNLYMQVDYNRLGFHFSEKLLVIEQNDSKTTHLHFASGPYPKGVEKHQLKFENWMDEVMEFCNKE